MIPGLRTHFAPFLGFVIALLLFPSAASPALGKTKPEFTTQTGHTESILAMDIDSTGKYLLTASSDNTASLWEITTGAKLRSFKGHTDQVVSVFFTPDDKFAITGSRDKTIRLWDIATARQIKIIKKGIPPIDSMAITNDGKRLLVAIADFGSMFVDIDTGKQLKTFLYRVNDMVVTLSPDNRYLATGCAEQYVILHDTETGNGHVFPKGGLFKKGHTGKITGVAFTPDSKYLISVSTDTTICLWDVAAKKHVATLKGHDGSINALAVSPDGSKILTGGDKGKFQGDLRIWDLKTRKLQTSFPEKSSIETVAFSPDGDFALAGGLSRFVSTWHIESKKRIAQRKGQPRPASSVAFHPDGNFLIVRNSSTLKKWNFATGVEEEFVEGITAFQLSPDGRQVAVFPGNGYTAEPQVDFIDFVSGKTTKSIPLKGKIKDHLTGKSIAISPDQRLAAWTHDDNTVSIWRLDSGDLTHTLSHGPDLEYMLYGLAFSPDGSHLAVGDAVGRIHLWDTANGKKNKTLVFTSREYQSPINPVEDIVFSPNGKYLVSGTWDGAWLWEVDIGQRVKTFTETVVNRVLVTPDGKYVLLSGDDNRVQLWDLNTGGHIRSFVGHTGPANGFSVSRDGRFLATASKDATAKIWDRDTGRELITLFSTSEGWTAVTPGGQFDGTPGGYAHARWTVGMKSYPVDAFFENYFEPGLLSRVMAGEALPEEQQPPPIAEGFSPPPVVAITSPVNANTLDKSTVEVTISALDQGGGVDEIRLFHNGRAIQSTSRAIRLKAKKGLTQKFLVPLSDKENVFRAVAYNLDRIESNPHEISVIYNGVKKQARLHLLVVGINQYMNSALNLNYAEPDARGIKDYFTAGYRNLFTTLQVNELYDSQATGTAIVSNLEKLQQTAPEDVVLIYMAGHGEAVGRDWYFIPHEVVYPEREERVQKQGVSAKKLSELIKKITAGKVLLLMDSCKSGAALIAFRGFQERKALAQLARATGIHVVSASTEDQFAAEVQELGHGVFTYTLLEALQGKADGSPGDGIVTVRELLSYVENRLPEISRQYKATAQYPVVDSRGMDFPISAK